MTKSDYFMRIEKIEKMKMRKRMKDNIKNIIKMLINQNNRIDYILSTKSIDYETPKNYEEILLNDIFFENREMIESITKKKWNEINEDIF